VPLAAAGAGWNGAHLAIRLIHTFTHPDVKMMSLLRIWPLRGSTVEGPRAKTRDRSTAHEMELYRASPAS
jgi:hypothetical protein